MNFKHLTKNIILILLFPTLLTSCSSTTPLTKEEISSFKNEVITRYDKLKSNELLYALCKDYSHFSLNIGRYDLNQNHKDKAKTSGVVEINFTTYSVLVQEKDKPNLQFITYDYDHEKLINKTVYKGKEIINEEKDVKLNQNDESKKIFLDFILHKNDSTSHIFNGYDMLNNYLTLYQDLIDNFNNANQEITYLNDGKYNSCEFNYVNKVSDNEVYNDTYLYKLDQNYLIKEVSYDSYSLIPSDKGNIETKLDESFIARRW